MIGVNGVHAAPTWTASITSTGRRYTWPLTRACAVWSSTSSTTERHWRPSHWPAPIMKAIETCSLDVVQMMINRGAKVRAEDRCCKSPALLLTRSTQPSHLSLGESNKCQRWLGFLQEFSCSVFSTFALVPSDIFQFCILLLCISCVLCRKLGLQSHVLISHI